jgi:hypothetical protein
MRWQQLIRLEKRGVRLAADVNAAVTVNQLERGAATNVAAASHARVVQDSRFAAQEGGGAEQTTHEQEDRNGQ